MSKTYLIFRISRLRTLKLTSTAAVVRGIIGRLNIYKTALDSAELDKPIRRVTSAYAYHSRTSRKELVAQQATQSIQVADYREQKGALENCRLPRYAAKVAAHNFDQLNTVVYSNSTIANGARVKILVISPHRDDAAFSVGLAVHRWLQAGHSVEVLNCFTRSEYALYSDADSVHANDRMSFVTALRKREDECWSKLYGRSITLTDLRLKDAPIRFRCSLEQVCEVPVRPEEKAFAKIVTYVAASKAAVVLPLGIGSHVDHLTARDAALSALDESRPYVLYEDLPYAAVAGAAAPEALAQEIAGRRGCILSPVFVGEPAAAHAAADAAFALKRRMALCYDSQVNDDAVNRIVEFSRQYGGRERLWANAAWRQAAPGLMSIPA